MAALDRARPDRSAARPRNCICRTQQDVYKRQVFAHSTEEVAELVKLCVAAEVPIVAFGAGTSLEGNVTPVRGGITIAVSYTHLDVYKRQERDNPGRTVFRVPALADLMPHSGV